MTTTTNANTGNTGKKTAQNASRAVEETVAATKENMESAVKATQEAYTKGLDNSMSIAREQVDRGSNHVLKSIEDAAAFNREAVDAWATAVGAMNKGMEDFAKSWFTLSRTLVENSLQANRAVMTASSVSEAVDVQSSYAKSAFDTMVSETTRMSEMSLKTANDTMAPISQRVNAAMERFGSSAA